MALHIPFLHYDIHSIHAYVCGILCEPSTSTRIMNATELAREEQKMPECHSLLVFSPALICIMICVAGAQTLCVILVVKWKAAKRICCDKKNKDVLIWRRFLSPIFSVVCLFRCAASNFKEWRRGLACSVWWEAEYSFWVSRSIKFMFVHFVSTYVRRGVYYATSSVHFEDQFSLLEQVHASSIETKSFLASGVRSRHHRHYISLFYVLESRWIYARKTQTKNLRVRIIFAILCVCHVPALCECNCISLQRLGCIGASRYFIVSAVVVGVGVVVVVVGIATIKISPSEFYVLHGTVSDKTFLM